MDPTYNKVRLTCFFMLCGSLLVQSQNVVKPISGTAGKCQDKSIICEGSYVAKLDYQCSDNQRFCSKMHHLQSTKKCDDKELQIITRDSWGARTPLSSLNNLSANLSFFIIHHAAGYDCSEQKKCLQQMKVVQKLHQSSDKGFDDIGYQYVIGGDGTVFEGRGSKYGGSHSPGYNTKSIGVCLLGNFMTTLPSSNAVSSLKKLHTCLQHQGMLSANNSVFGHKDVRPTSCPGKEFYDRILTEDFGSFWHRIEPVMWTDCKLKDGICKDNTTETCEGEWKKKLCPGQANIVCCI